jgi:hypothetical protein
MNMHYEMGQFVGYMPIEEPISVPVSPERWFMLGVTPGRDARVVNALTRRGACAYSPTVVRYIDRRTKVESRKPHLGKRVERPFLAGMVFVPDFDVSNPASSGSTTSASGSRSIGRLRHLEACGHGYRSRHRRCHEQCAVWASATMPSIRWCRSSMARSPALSVR